MKIEWWILLIVYVLGTVILFLIPKNKMRLAVVAFLFKQVITFFWGLVVVECGLLEYPVRLFASINRTSFTYEYFAFPVMCALFNVWYPNNRSILFRLGYYFAFTTLLTLTEVIVEKYTDLIRYIHWEWYISWVTIWLSFFIVRIFCLWFFSNGKVSYDK